MAVIGTAVRCRGLQQAPAPGFVEKVGGTADTAAGLRRGPGAAAWSEGAEIERDHRLRNHRMELQYEGTGLHGWAKQDGLPTVEGSLEEAFRTVLGLVPEWRVAGRTDAGVHARRQVLSLRLPAGLDLRKLRRSLNALTPAGVAVTTIVPAPERFDARADAASRTYRYFVSTGPVVSPFWSRYCWHLPVELDWASMEAAAALAAGRHDFTAFTPTETEHVLFERLVLRCRWQRVRGDFPGASRPGRSEGLRYLEVEAEAFLRHMVRTLVGTMVEVGQGAMTRDEFASLLAGASRRAAGPTAPAHGLVLWDVSYKRRDNAVDTRPRPATHREEAT